MGNARSWLIGSLVVITGVAVVGVSPAFADVTSPGSIVFTAGTGDIIIASQNFNAGDSIFGTAVVGKIAASSSTFTATNLIGLSAGGAGSSITGSTLTGSDVDLDLVGSGDITNSHLTATKSIDAVTINDIGVPGSTFTISGSQIAAAGDLAGGVLEAKVTVRGGCQDDLTQVTALETVSPTENFQFSFPPTPGPATCMGAVFSMGSPLADAVDAFGPGGSNGVEVGDPVGTPSPATGKASIILTFTSSLPIVIINAPATGGTYNLNQTVPTSFTCQGTCHDSNGATGGVGALDTSTAGGHTYVLTDSNGGNTITRSISYTVNKATPALTWAPPASIVYGTALSATQLNAAASVLGTFTYSPSAGTVLSAGARTLSVTFTPTDTADYNSTSTTVPIAVTPAVLNVHALSFTRSYGMPNPPLVYTITGFVNGDTSAVVSGAPVLTTTATATSNAGSYPISITIGTLQASNYSFLLVGGTVTVTKAPTVLTASPLLLTVKTAPLGIRITIGTVSARLINAATGLPLSGQHIAFRTLSGKQVCAANTNAAGVATCTTSVVSLLKLLIGSGYLATFATTTNLAAASATAPVIKIGP